MRQEEKRLIQNKYEIVSKIKQGGFGIVYKGYDHVFEKPVAIKAIEPSLLREAKYIDLFLEEAKNAGKLSHNNIVHIYNLVRDENGQFFIIMEYVDGVDLGKVLRICRKKNILIPQELSIFIVKEICKALEYAHNKRDLMTDKPLRLDHQDISPSNIMTSLSGHVKLIDFGLAKIRSSSNNSDEMVLSGKLPYMAPEQVNSGSIDRRSDIFSLGTVFYEMLTGTRLFPLNDPQETIELIKKILKFSEEGRNEEAFDSMLEVTAVVNAETGRYPVLILDEFDRLKHFKLKNEFQTLGKKIMIQKNTLYVVSSSSVYEAKRIIAEKLSLLFGNFQIIEFVPFDVDKCAAFVDGIREDININSKFPIQMGNLISGDTV